VCTLTFIPQPKGAIFTHSRDEDPSRPSSKEILKKQVKKGIFYFPQDLKAKGTWMGTWVSSERDAVRTACILNGGSVPYKRKSTYLKSRGLLIPSLMDMANVKELYQGHNFLAYEPFTLIVYEGKRLYKLVHNPNETFLVEEDALQSHIWSSTKLYSLEIRELRKNHFYTWLNSQEAIKPQTLREFHLRGNNEAKLPGFRLKIENVIETVSLTQVAHSLETARMHYHNLEYKAVKELLT
jgi:hypothetical protein